MSIESIFEFITLPTLGWLFLNSFNVNARLARIEQFIELAIGGKISLLNQKTKPA